MSIWILLFWMILQPNGYVYFLTGQKQDWPGQLELFNLILRTPLPDGGASLKSWHWCMPALVTWLVGGKQHYIQIPASEINVAVEYTSTELWQLTKCWSLALYQTHCQGMNDFFSFFFISKLLTALRGSTMVVRYWGTWVTHMHICNCKMLNGNIFEF